MNQTIINTVLIFSGIILVFFILKPKYFFDENNRPKTFGLKKHQAIITPIHIALFASIFYYLYLIK